MKNTLLLLILLMVCVNMADAQSWITLLRNADRQAADGKWQEAAALYTNVLKATTDKTARLECLQHRASCYKHLDTYDLAQTDYESALALCTDSTMKAVVSYNMADLLIQTGQYARVVTLLESVRFNKPDQECRRLANIATAYAYTGQSDKALAMLNDIIASHTQQDLTRTLLLQNRGFILWEMKRYDKALQDLQAALPQLQENAHYIALGNVALVEAELKRYDAALQHIDEALTWQAQAPGIGTTHSTYLITLRKKAEILLKAQRSTSAATAYKEFFKAEKEYVHTNFSKLSEQARLDFWLKENPLVSEMFALGNVEAAFLYDVALFRRNMALLGSRTAQQPTLLEQTLAHSRSTVASRLQAHEAAVEIVCYQDIVSGDSIYAALVCTKSDTRFTVIGRKADIHGYSIAGATLQKAVCQGARYAQSIYGDTILAAMVWTPIRQTLPPGIKRIYFAPEGIFQMLGIEHLPYPQFGTTDLRRVSATDRIWHATISSTGKALIIGGLDYNEEDTRKPIVKSGSNLTAYRTALELCGSPLAFKKLPATVPEADSVAHIMGGSYVHLVWEDELKRSMGNYHTIHLATHGYSLQVSLDRPSVLTRDSLRHDNSLWACGIALTGANVQGKENAAEDGLLSAREVCDLDLSSVRFVALSACQTAQGIVSDEGPAGMLRALKKAGAGTIIATLWAVNDKATRIFMRAFYKAWRTEHKDVHTAFHQAQEAVRRYAMPQAERRLPLAIHRQSSPKDKATPKTFCPYLSPQYWAPFILID